MFYLLLFLVYVTQRRRCTLTDFISFSGKLRVEVEAGGRRHTSQALRVAWEANRASDVCEVESFETFFQENRRRGESVGSVYDDVEGGTDSDRVRTYVTPPTNMF